MELSKKAEEFLQGRHVGVLSTVDRDIVIHSTLVWYELQNGIILMNTVIGRRKEENMRLRPFGSLCIVDMYKYVTISGYVEFIDDLLSAKGDILGLASRYDGVVKAMKQYEETFSKQERISFRLPLATAKIFEYFH